MSFQKIIVTVRITCNGPPKIIEVDVIADSGRFHNSSVLDNVHRNHHGCTAEILDMGWVTKIL